MTVTTMMANLGLVILKPKIRVQRGGNHSKLSLTELSLWGISIKTPSLRRVAQCGLNLGCMAVLERVKRTPNRSVVAQHCKQSMMEPSSTNHAPANVIGIPLMAPRYRLVARQVNRLSTVALRGMSLLPPASFLIGMQLHFRRAIVIG